MDYSNWLQKMMTVREEMRTLDSEKLYRYYLPNKGCSEEDILQVENHLKITLDKQYAEFLKFVSQFAFVFLVILFKFFVYIY